MEGRFCWKRWSNCSPMNPYDIPPDVAPHDDPPDDRSEVPPDDKRYLPYLLQWRIIMPLKFVSLKFIYHLFLYNVGLSYYSYNYFSKFASNVYNSVKL